MEKKFILLELLINQPCLPRELKDLFKKYNQKLCMYKPMNNGGTQPNFLNMLIHKKNSITTMFIQISILKPNPSTCGTHLEQTFSGSDTMLTWLFSDIISVFQKITQNQVLKLNLLWKKQKKLEQRLISLVLCMTKSLGIDSYTKPELLCFNTFTRDWNISIALSGLQKEQKLLQDKITQLYLNTQNNAQIPI